MDCSVWRYELNGFAGDYGINQRDVLIVSEDSQVEIIGLNRCELDKRIAHVDLKGIC